LADPIPDEEFTVSYPSGGRHFLQIPGPTNVPDRVLRAIAAPAVDHRGPAFQALALEVLHLLGPFFATTGPVMIYRRQGPGLAGTLAGVQMGLQLAEVPVHPSGVDVALELLRA
jgi:aspartate aminotransferase-like enzyme